MDPTAFDTLTRSFTTAGSRPPGPVAGCWLAWWRYCRSRGCSPPGRTGQRRARPSATASSVTTITITTTTRTTTAVVAAMPTAENSIRPVVPAIRVVTPISSASLSSAPVTHAYNAGLHRSPVVPAIRVLKAPRSAAVAFAYCAGFPSSPVVPGMPATRGPALGDSANNNRDRGPSRHGPHPAAAACTSCSGSIAGSGTDLGTVPSGIACQHTADGPVDQA